MTAVRRRSLVAWWAMASGFLCSCAPALAQGPSLGLSPGTGGPGTTVNLALSLGGFGTAAAGLQWTLVYSSGEISAIGATAGPAAVAAGKTVTCTSTPGLLTCVAIGPNTNSMSAGIVANVQATLAGNATTTSIFISNAVGVDGTGSALPALTTAGGSITVASTSSITCTPGSLSGGQISNCSATLNTAAPAGGSTISLLSNNPLLTVPATITVAPGNTSSTFNATAAATIPGNQSATITGAWNGGSSTATINLVTQGLVSGVACSPTSLGQSGVSTCTVTLAQAAPAGGWGLALASNKLALTVPASVTVAAGATMATFSATAAAIILTNRSATVTATLGGSSQTATINLLAPGLVSGVACSPTSLGQSAVSTCTVTLGQTAPLGGLGVTLASNNPSLTVPASVSVLAGATTGTFSATAAASIASSQSATVTATVSGSSQTATVNLSAPVLVSSVACNPAVLGPGGSSNCNLNLTQAFPGISLVHATSCGPQTFPRSTCTIPATGSGNLVVVGWQTGGGVYAPVTVSSVTDNAGNTYAEAGAALSVDSAAGSVADIWYARNSISGATTLVITPSSPITSGSAVIWEFSGADLLAPLDQTAVLDSQAASAAPPGAAVTTSAASDVVISLAVAGNVTAILPPNTFVSDSTVQGNGWAHLITSSAGTYGALWNQSAAGTYASSTAAFKAAGSVTLTSNNLLLAVPASVTVPLGATTATFSATAAANIASSQNATVTAAFGSSSQTATLGLLAPAPVVVLISAVTCNATGVMSGASTTCSIVLSQPVSANTTVWLNSSSALLSIPPSLTVSAGSALGIATATASTVPSNTQAVVTASLGLSSQNATVQLWSNPSLSSLTCTPTKIAVGAASSCTVAMSNSAGSLVIGISSSNPALFAPAGVTVPQGSSSGSFTVTAQAADAHSIVLTASYNGGSALQSMLISGTAQTQSIEATGIESISCEPGRSRRTCRVAFKTRSDPGTVELTSSNQSIRLPATIAVQPGQSSATFQVDAISPANGSATTVTARLGADVVQETVSLSSRPGPLDVPGYLYAKYGSKVQFRVSVSDAAATLVASEVPPGAVFDASSGVFQWIPDAASRGTHRIVFAEVGPTGASVTASSVLEVDSGTPVVTRVVNAASRSTAAACSPGAIATLEGKWLVEGHAASDPTGHSTVLSGTMVRINGIEAPILSVSISQVDFLCPAALPGSTLEIALQTLTGVAQPVQTFSQETTPGIFSLDGSGTGQGMIMHAGTATLVTTPNYQYLSRAALPDEPVTVYATGIAAAQEVLVVAGGAEISPQSIVALPGLAGMYQVSIRLPAALAYGNTSLSLKIKMLDGSLVTSNEVWFVAEATQQQ
jgi:trimeric autotransporter adhesin